MSVELKQISSLEKVRPGDEFKYKEILSKTVLGGERFSYQICAKKNSGLIRRFKVEIESEIVDYVKLFSVKNSVMDLPVTEIFGDEDYITKEAGLMPDMLIPLEENRNLWTVAYAASSIWISVEVPRGFKPGKYSVNVKMTTLDYKPEDELAPEYSKTMQIEVLNVSLPEQKLIYTRWFYADCIADIHNVPIYSEKHWELIDKYIYAASNVGINMILLPVHTPPLDTEIGETRPCVQLVDIKKENGKYTFGFEKFKRFVDICKKNGIKYYEMAHMFSQWGAKCAPNIMVEENGIKSYMFGWDVASDSEEYISFLTEYISAIAEELRREGIAENTYFHISDEPTLDAIDTYMRAYNILKPLIGNSKTFDALSEFEFYKKGLVECPVTIVSHINEFLEHKIENQWVYYCCGPQSVYTNSIMAMPSYRTRILGIQIYKYDIKGFLHWGFNFYNARRSQYKINPYVTSSADRVFPSGDPFIVYPGNDCVYSSIRGEITYEALQDIDVCRALEKYIGRDNVIEMIDSMADMDLRFDEYPKDTEFLPSLREKMIEEIRQHI